MTKPGSTADAISAGTAFTSGNVYLPAEAQIVDRIAETDTVFTLRLRFTDERLARAYRFAPGQFNMVSLFGVGEVPISIVSDPEDAHLLDHTIRTVGRVTGGLAALRAGDRVGLRGPFGRGWPLERARGRDVLLITGGLGCAPVVSVIRYIMRRRERFGHLTVMQGVKHANDLIYRSRLERWGQVPDTTLLLAADHGGPLWPWHQGHVTELFDRVTTEPGRTIAMLCGPEGMMRVAIRELLARDLPPEDLYLSMERSMHCAVGHCGHCQFGPHFVCRDGPVFAYSEISDLLGVKGF